MTIPICYLDAEYRNTSEPHVTPVSVAWNTVFPSTLSDIQDDHEKSHSLWLYRDLEAQKKFAHQIELFKKRDFLFVSYNVTAEARFLSSIGINPQELKWLDLYAEWKQAQNNCNDFEYGRYATKQGTVRVSTPPSFDTAKNIGRDMTPVGSGYGAAVLHQTGIQIDTPRKDRVRNIIIHQSEFTESEQAEILEYNLSDIQYIPLLLQTLSPKLMEYLKMDEPTYLRAAQHRGRYMADVARMEDVGIPVDVNYLTALSQNFASATDTLITDLVENVYPFYARKKRHSDKMQGAWVEKASQFEKYLAHKKLLSQWPKTEKGFLATDDDTLSMYDADPGLRNLRQTKKLVKQLQWFRPEGYDNIHSSLGSDASLRVFLNPYGTQTGRNAPSPKNGYVLAMSSWLRCLLRAPENHSIVSIDYASQEFAIAAWMSGDKNMKAAYLSGDPYLYFAKLAGAVPWDGTKSEYSDERALFKSTTLGLQYGMGADKLMVKLRLDTGKDVTWETAQKLIDLHKESYPDYWDWMYSKVDEYKMYQSLILADGFALMGDNDNMLSVRNFPVQGTGGVILRRAVKLCHDAGLKIFAPLHDALYFLMPNDKLEEQVTMAQKLMVQAVHDVLDESCDMRLDTHIVPRTEDYVEEKGAAFYEKLKHYLVPKERDDAAYFKELFFTY